MNIFFRLLFVIGLYFTSILLSFANSGSSLQTKLVGVLGGSSKSQNTDVTISLGTFFSFVKSELFTIFTVIAVGAFVYVGVKMAAARGNPEEFKKAWMHFLYIIIGIFIVLAAWGIVNLIQGIKL